jgi:hypothetical protein
MLRQLIYTNEKRKKGKGNKKHKSKKYTQKRRKKNVKAGKKQEGRNT